MNVGVGGGVVVSHGYLGGVVGGVVVSAEIYGRSCCSWRRGGGVGSVRGVVGDRAWSRGGGVGGAYMCRFRRACVRGVCDGCRECEMSWWADVGEVVGVVLFGGWVCVSGLRCVVGVGGIVEVEEIRIVAIVRRAWVAVGVELAGHGRLRLCRRFLRLMAIIFVSIEL